MKLLPDLQNHQSQYYSSQIIILQVESYLHCLKRLQDLCFATLHFFWILSFSLFGSLLFVSAWWIWSLPVTITISMRCSWEPLIFSLNTEAYLGLLFFFLNICHCVMSCSLQATIFLTDLLYTEEQQRKRLCWCVCNEQCLCEYLRVAWKQ